MITGSKTKTTTKTNNLPVFGAAFAIYFFCWVSGCDGCLCPFSGQSVAFLLGRTCSTDCELFNQQWHCPSSMRRRILQPFSFSTISRSESRDYQFTEVHITASSSGKTLPTPYSLHTKTSDLSIVHLDDTIYDIASRFYIIGPHSNPPSRLVPFFYFRSRNSACGTWIRQLLSHTSSSSCIKVPPRQPSENTASPANPRKNVRSETPLRKGTPSPGRLSKKAINRYGILDSGGFLRVIVDSAITELVADADITTFGMQGRSCFV